MTVLVEAQSVTISKQDTLCRATYAGSIHSASRDTKLKILLVSMIFVVSLLLQFLFREYDNNRLLSWQWTMSQESLFLILAISISGLVVVYKSCFLHISKNKEILIVVAGSYIIGMASWSAPEVMVDSGRYFIHAKLIATHGIGYFLSEWGYGINAWTDLPLASIIYGTAFSLFGESRLAIQVINTFLFSGSVFLTYLVGKELWDAKTGIIAAVLLLAIPFLHVQASQMLVDVPAMFFAIAAILLSIIAVKKTGIGWVLLASASIVFALLTKYSVWIALSSIVVLPFALKDCDRLEVAKRLLLISLVTAVLLVFVFYVHHPVILKQLKILLDYQLPALQRWQESYTSTFLYQAHPFVSLAAIASLYFAVKKKETIYIIPAAALCVMLVMGVYRARYLLIVYPMLALVAAYGFRQLEDKFLQRFIVRSAVVVSLAVTFVASMNFLQHHYSAVNLKDAGRYLNTIEQANVAVIVLPQPQTAVNPAVVLPLLDYYSDKKFHRVGGVAIPNPIDERSQRTSPLRFTWEVKQHVYPNIKYEEVIPAPVLVLLSSDSEKQLPDSVAGILNHYVLDERFSVTDDVFRFQSVVTVYRHKANVQDSTL
ncbi:MAG: glycosyltransferase family 39 protein [Gammaproteobacteria bacterium]|jgi:4-amino-4-deoxy-L-arabinose transferase-like glycosyltransferase